MLSAASADTAKPNTTVRPSQADRAGAESIIKIRMKVALGDLLGCSPGAFDECVGQVNRITGVKNDADGCHVADISVRRARRDQQKIGSVEHIIALVGARGALARQLKGD